MPEILRDAGYYTAGVISHRLLGSRYGFDRGYAHYSEDDVHGHRHLSTPGVTDEALSLLTAFSRPDPEDAQRPPFFLFLHFFDPHFEYLPHPEFGLAPVSAGRLDGSEDIKTLQDLRHEMTEEEIRFVTDLYDGEIRYTDVGIGRVLAALDELGLRDDTVVIFTADHGEEFMERGWIGHTISLHQEVVHVPLLMRIPDVAPGVVEEAVSLVSLFPTILELAGVSPPDSTSTAQSLVPLARARESAVSTPVYAEVAYRQHADMRATKQALIAYPYKVMRDFETDEVMVFDLAQDPEERRDVAAENPDRTADLLVRMARVHRTGAEARAGSPELSEEEKEALRSLGYIR